VVSQERGEIPGELLGDSGRIPGELRGRPRDGHGRSFFFVAGGGVVVLIVVEEVVVVIVVEEVVIVFIVVEVVVVFIVKKVVVVQFLFLFAGHEEAIIGPGGFLGGAIGPVEAGRTLNQAGHGHASLV
jgi:hypothetical protein